MTRFAAVLVALALPALVAAQGGGSDRIPRRGTAPPDYDRLVAGAGAPNQLTNRDLEWMSPFRHLMDGKKDLSLSEDQLKRLKEMADALRGKNAPQFGELDSLRKEMKPSDAVPEVERIRVRGVRQAFVDVVRSVRSTHDAAEPDALAVLNEEQRKAAVVLLERARDADDELLRRKLGGGRRGS